MPREPVRESDPQEHASAIADPRLDLRNWTANQVDAVAAALKLALPVVPGFEFPPAWRFLKRAVDAIRLCDEATLDRLADDLSRAILPARQRRVAEAGRRRGGAR